MKEMSVANILIVEDDSDIREGVRILLESEGYDVEEAEDGFAALELLSEKTDLVILDVMMPGISGIKTCEEIRKKSYVPILFLTAKSQESDKLIGLMAGGDDYLPKPFSYAELLGRVKALLRRYQVYRGKASSNLQSEQYLELGGIKINLEFNEVFVDDKEVDLSNIEYNILLLMMKHPQRIFQLNISMNLFGTSRIFIIAAALLWYTSASSVLKLRRMIRSQDALPLFGERGTALSRFQNRKSSIYRQLGTLLVFSAIISAIFFVALNAVGEYAIRYFVMNTDYMEREDSKKINHLQTYITENQVSANDSEKLTKWVKKQSVVTVQIYRNGYIIYDSQYPEAELDETADNRYNWRPFYTLSFADGSAEVVLYGFYDYQFYNYALIGELVLAFLMFLGIVMLGIRRTIHYIRKLSQEIKILEGGELGYPITVKGRDELAQLAEGLDSMRQSFRRQTEQEKQLTLANQRMITEMSHDLRTPLTSIMLYTEILLKNKCRNEEQKASYIQKIDQKARRLKQLSDHLFEYALITGEEEVKLEGPFPLTTVFYDLLSETVSYLEQQGFHVTLAFKWETCDIRINQNYIARIFDNLTSNVVKYADPSEQIMIQSICSGHSVGIAVKNKKKAPDGKTESNKIGLRNVQKMMEKMGGRAVLEQNDKDFAVTILFPTVLAKG